MSTKIWYCASCGYEVSTRGRCHSCGQRLVASPLPELESGPDDDEVGYRLDQWDDLTRGRLIGALAGAGVLHRFEDEELVVLAVDEPEVDRIVERVSGAGAGLDEEDEEAEPVAEGDANAAREVYEAARRLRDDPTDMQADGALSEASALLFAADRLPGTDEAHLAALGRVTRRLLGALGADEALEDEIRHQADVLCRLTAPAAGLEQVGQEAARARASLEAGARQKGRQVELPHSRVTPAGEMVLVPGTEADLLELGERGGGVPGEATAGPGGEEPGTGSGAPTPAVPTGAVPDEELDEDLDEEEADDASGELVFELGEWLPEQRVELSLLLEGAGVSYNWDGPDLTVAEEHEAEVEGMFGLVPGLADEDDEARYRLIEELFAAVGRLANDPMSEERQQVFLGAVGAVEQPTPVGVDDAYWWRVRSQGRALVAAIEGTGRPDEISRDASLLAEMLHEMV